jgi:hypothetical protein
LARTLGRGLGSKDVALKNVVRVVSSHSHGGASNFQGVKILVLIGRQGRIHVDHQRGDGYLITDGIGGSKQVTNGFVYEVSAGTRDYQSRVLHQKLESIYTHRPVGVSKSTPYLWRLSRVSSSLSPSRRCDILNRFLRCASSSECDGKGLEMGLM